MDDPNYCLYYKIMGHPTKNCYIFKDILQTLLDADVLKLHSKQKNVTANLTSIHFSRDLPLTSVGLVIIPKRKQRVINIDPHNKNKRACPYPLSSGRDNVGLL